MKNNILYNILLGISISLLLLSLPAAASDNMLGIFGNANEDGSINIQDVEYTERIILGLDDQTQLADAKYDDKVDILDVTQIELIILGSGNELTILDSADRIVTVDMPVERVIIFFDAEGDMLRMLKAGDKVVAIGSGIGEENLLLPEISKLPTVGSWSNPDYEAILSYNPDIVMACPGTMAGLEEKVEPFTKVIRIDHGNPEVIVDSLIKLGYILDKREGAEEFIDWYESYIDEIKERTEGLSEEDKPRVFIEFFPYLKKYRTEGKGSVGHILCTIAGGVNIAGDLSKSCIVDTEWVIEQNPDIIIQSVGSKLPSGYGVDNWTEVKAIREETLNRPELQNVAAVDNENVYLLASDIYHTNTQSIVSIAYLAKWFHPELFEDLDPQAIHQEYLTEFQRLDYDLNEHGVFVYPPLEEN